MSFICPICNEKFKSEQSIQKHFLMCWKEKHPFHQSKSASYSGETMTREMNDDVTNLFNTLGVR